MLTELFENPTSWLGHAKYEKFALYRYSYNEEVSIECDEFDIDKDVITFKTILEELNKHDYNMISVNFKRSAPVEKSLLNIVLPEAKNYKIKKVKISWESLNDFKEHENIKELTDIELYLADSKIENINTFLHSIALTTKVNIRCYENTPDGYLLDNLQEFVIKTLQKRNIKYKNYIGY